MPDVRKRYFGCKKFGAEVNLFMQLSKSEYMMFLKHPAWLWLKKHDKGKLPLPDAALQAMFDDGHEFEKYAERLFTDAIRVGFSYEQNNYRTMPVRTKEAIESGAKIILQGRLEAGEITCIFDVIERVGECEYDLYEIKSSTEVKEDHILDLAFQKIVLEKAGLKIRKTFVIHVNNKYERTGEIDIAQLTTQTEVTEQVNAHMGSTVEQIQKALMVAYSPLPPDFSPRHVGLRALDEWMAIYEAMFPQEHPHNIFKLTHLNPLIVGELEDLGVKLIADIPEGFKLNSKQQRQVRVTKEDRREVNKENIKEFLSKFEYPLYFFDYETFNAVIPPFDGLHPYQQVPFQYSIHRLEQDGTMTHKEFLHTDNSHPGLPLLKQLVKDIGDKGTVLVWYEAFEKGRNDELGLMFPEYAQAMKKLNERIVDLMIPFSSGWFVDKDFFGSASIKKVFPVLISELSYEKLEIKEGGTASRTWKETYLEGKNSEQKKQIVKDLLAYCGLDTLAMVQLFEFLRTEVS